jgi:hypothetical protein
MYTESKSAVVRVHCEHRYVATFFVGSPVRLIVIVKLRDNAADALAV